MNPHEMIGQPRSIWWGDLTLGVPIELEFIDYFKAQSVKFARGEYMLYYAVAVSDYEPLKILKGDEIIFHISYRTYQKELMKLPNEQRIPTQRKFAEGKNLYINLEKVSREKIKIYSQEPREPTEEQLKEAESIYKMIRGVRER